jgi:hypothetical protein
MLYVVEMDLPDRSQEVPWHRWYVSHIRKLLTVPGYNGAQRFRALAPSASPFLAIHDVAGADVFESTEYRAVGGPQGTGQWRELMTNWHRNLYAGRECMPTVGADEVLVLLDASEGIAASLAERVTWLESVGLDRSIERRGFVVLTGQQARVHVGDAEHLHLYKPISGKIC